MKPIIRNFRVDCDYDNSFELTAVVACENEEDAAKICGFDGEDYHNIGVVWIGDSVYSKPTLICAESL